MFSPALKQNSYKATQSTFNLIKEEATYSLPWVTSKALWNELQVSHINTLLQCLCKDLPAVVAAAESQALAADVWNVTCYKRYEGMRLNGEQKGKKDGWEGI